MLQAFYQNWAKSCLAAALFLFALLFSSIHQLNYVVFLIWLQVPIYLLHEFEEHAYPGGFKNFINTVMFKSTVPNFPLSDASLFWINIPYIWIMFPIFAILAQHVDIHLGVILPCFALFNATTHILVGIIKRRYNPGLCVSVLLNYPSGIYTLHVMSQQGLLDWQTNLLGWGVAFLGHLIMFSSIVIYYKKHRARLG